MEFLKRITINFNNINHAFHILDQEIIGLTPILSENLVRIMIVVSNYFFKFARMLKKKSILDIITHRVDFCLIEVLGIEIEKVYTQQAFIISFHPIFCEPYLLKSKRIALERSVIQQHPSHFSGDKGDRAIALMFQSDIFDFFYLFNQVSQ
jgi:hypothetical protein